MEIIAELLKPILQKLLKFIEVNDYWTFSIYLFVIVVIILVIGYGLTWAIQIRKLKQEVLKLNLESKDKKIILVEKVQLKRKVYVESSELIQLSVRLCIQALTEQNKNELEKNRTELNDLFFNELVNQFTEYIEVCEVYYEGDSKKINNCIIDEVFPFLETCKIFLDAVNNSNILRVLREDKIQLFRSTVNPILRFTQKNLGFFEVKAWDKYKLIINNINFKSAT